MESQAIPEHVTHLKLFTYPMSISEENIEVPKGGASESTPVRISIPDKCVPSDHCIVRLRDRNDNILECPAEITVNSPTASPSSVAKYFDDQKLTDAGKCDGENVHGGDSSEPSGINNEERITWDSVMNSKAI